MKKRNKLLIWGSGLLLALGIGLSVQNTNAVTFYDCLGKGTFNFFYNVKDYKNITASGGYTAGEKANSLGLYSGITNARICIDCDKQLNQNIDDGSIEWVNARVYAPDKTNKYPQVTQYRKGNDMVYYKASVPEGVKDGLHYACVQVIDTAGNYSKSNKQTNCYKFYYDINGPTFKKDGIVVNEGHAYTRTGNNIPVEMVFYDNYAGVASLSYNNGFEDDPNTTEDESVTVLDFDNLPEGSRFSKRRDTSGKWTYSLSTYLTLNSDISEINIVFTGTDRVKNIGKSKAVSLRFDKKAPVGEAEIVTNGGNTVSSNVVNVDYKLEDKGTLTHKYPSGFRKIEVMEEDGTNKQTIFTDNNLKNKNGTNKFDTTGQFTLSTCKEPIRLKIVMTDRAGNTNTIYTNEVTCSNARISQYDVTEVENPGVYADGPLPDPFSWIFKDNDEPEYMEEIAKALAGGNFWFDFEVEWEGDPNATVTAQYEIIVKSEGGSTTKSSLVSVKGSPFVERDGKLYSSFTDNMGVIPSDAADGSKVYIKIYATITSPSDITNPTHVYFDKNGKEAWWGEVEGSVEDYLQFGEIN